MFATSSLMGPGMPLTSSTAPNAASEEARTSIPQGSEPFGDYYIRVLKLKNGDGFVADLAAACATLYLFRSDPNELQNLAEAWATLARREMYASEVDRNCGCKNTQLPPSDATVDSSRRMSTAADINTISGHASLNQSGEDHHHHHHHHHISNTLLHRHGGSSEAEDVGMQQRSSSAYLQVIATAKSAAHTPTSSMSNRFMTADIGGGLTESHHGMTPSQSHHYNSASSRITNTSAVGGGHHPPLAPTPHSPQDGHVTMSRHESANHLHHSSSGDHHHPHRHHKHRHHPHHPDVPDYARVEEDFVGLFFSSLQCCVETYFNYRWDVLDSVAAANEQYKTFVEQELIPRCHRHMRTAGLGGTNPHVATPRGADTIKTPRSGQKDSPPPSQSTRIKSASPTPTPTNTNTNTTTPTTQGCKNDFKRSDTLEVCGEDGGSHTATPSPRGGGMSSRTPSEYRHVRDIPDSLNWVTRSSISNLYKEASTASPSPRGIVLIFHAGFSPHSCKAVKELNNMFTRWNQRYADRQQLQECGGSEETLLNSPSVDVGGLSSELLHYPPSGGGGGDSSFPISPSSSSVSIFSPQSGMLEKACSAELFTSPVGPTASSDQHKIISRPPLWGVVNAPAEMQLTLDYNVKWYPSIVLIPPTSLRPPPPPPPRQYGVASPSTESVSTATEGSAATLELSTDTDIDVKDIASGSTVEPMSPSLISTVLPFSHPPTFLTYPERGIRQDRYLYHWISTDGRHAARVQKFVSGITKLVKLDKAHRFAAKREQMSAAVKLQQIQKCNLPKEEVQKYRTTADPPMFIMMGGGMASGKTTAASALTQTDFWKRHGECAVVVDADEFKMADPLFSEQVPDLHKRSTVAAENLLLEAVNTQRDVVYDGTMSWLPYVEQTINMVRQAHEYEFEQGPGWLPDKGVEQYWVQSKKKETVGVPYVVRFMGITVDPRLAVQRGILRRMSTGRVVPVAAQLRSFRLFAWAFPVYAELCDSIVLFNNNVRVDLEKGELPMRIAEKKLGATELTILDQAAFDEFTRQMHINDRASNEGSAFLSSPQRPDWEVPNQPK